MPWNRATWPIAKDRQSIQYHNCTRTRQTQHNMVQQQHSINTAHNTFLFLAGLKKLWTNASNLLLNTPSNSLPYFSVRSELLDLQTKPRATRERQWTTTNCLDMKDRVPIWKHVGTGYVRTIIKPRKKKSLQLLMCPVHRNRPVLVKIST